MNADNELFDALCDHLVEAGYDERVTGLALAAWEGADALKAELDAVGHADAVPRTVPHTPRAQAAAPPTANRAYLERIRVQAFRGIGPAAELELRPGNGLTLVLGRNGSGKSSFAEGLEMLLTGENARWQGKTADWKNGWKNLHADAPVHVSADFILDGTTDRPNVARAWAGDDLDTSQLTLSGAPVDSLDTLGWTDALNAYRPFLPYSELAGWADRPAQLHNAVLSVLGLDRFDAVADLLDAARKRLDANGKALKPKTAAMRGQLDASDDPRAAAALEGFLKTKVKPEVIAAVLSEPVDAEADHDRAALNAIAQLRFPTPERVAEVARGLRDSAADLEAATLEAASQSDNVARLLRAALNAYDGAPQDTCHVCGTPEVLSPRWRAEADGRATSLEEGARTFRRAQERLKRHLEEARRMVAVPPVPVVESCEDILKNVRLSLDVWTQISKLTDPIEIANALEESHAAAAAHVAEAVTAANAELTRRQTAWGRLAGDLTRWLEEVHAVEADKPTIESLKHARQCMLDTSATLRDLRFAPVVEQAKEIWNTLRVASNVSLVDLALSGKGNRRKLVVDIAVDDSPAAAVGVMSQGELHAMALSLFLPRASLDASPFGFVVIDDPVQAMDAARVDGLARALQAASKNRQVIVFTHDDRLAEAVRRLDIAATVKRVERSPNSSIRVVDGRDPVAWYLDDARAIARDSKISGDVVQRVIPGLCRLALDAAVCNALRKKRLYKGDSHASIDELLDRNKRLARRMSLLLLDKPGKDAREVSETIRNRWGADLNSVFHEANKGAHSGQVVGDPLVFVKRCRSLARELENL